MKFETDFDALCRDLSALTEGVPYVIAILPIRQPCSGSGWRG